MREEAVEVRRFALQAAKELKSYSPAGKVVGIGADGTPTMDVDKMVEDMIVEESSKFKFNLLSEELGYLDRGSDWTIIADPIDGTRNLLRGIPFYCISLALSHASDLNLNGVVYGIVLDLKLGELFEALKGGGAFLNGKPMSTLSFERNLLSISTKEVGDELKSKLMNWNVRVLGAAALETCYVANGRLDLYYNDGKGVRITDIAASSLILRENGGEVYDLERKKRLTMGSSLAERAKVLAIKRGEEISRWLS